MREKSKTISRRQYALTMLALVLAVWLISMFVNGGHLFAGQAQRDMELRNGWENTRQIWREQVKTALEGNRSMCLYVVEDSFVLAEQSWNALEGWYMDAVSMVETRADRPVQSGFEFYQEGETCILYLAGKITDPSVKPEDITYQLWWHQQAREEYPIRVEDRFQYQEEWYFVRAIDISGKEMPMACDVLIKVMDENGNAIRWEDGYADDYGDWMLVSESTYVD